MSVCRHELGVERMNLPRQLQLYLDYEQIATLIKTCFSNQYEL